jgi:ferredoxin
VNLVMVRYRVIVDRDRCTGCGMSIGRCPTHIGQLLRVLTTDKEDESLGFFSEELYDHVKTLVDLCPSKAIVIEKTKRALRM